jgi:hypothetical protein
MASLPGMLVPEKYYAPNPFVIAAYINHPILFPGMKLYSKLPLFSALVGLLIVGCSSKPEVASTLEEVPVANLVQVSEVYQDNDFFLGQPSVVRSDQDGNIYVADNSTMRIYAFDATGKLLYHIGGKGTGPGEFNGFGINQFWIANDGSLQVYDNNTRRLSIFRKVNGQYAFDTSFTIQSPEGSRSFPMAVVPVSHNQYVVTYPIFSMENAGRASQDPVHLVGIEGIPTDSALVRVTGMEYLVNQSGNSIMITSKAFTNHTLLGSFQDGTFLTFWTGTAGAKVYDTNGEFVREFEFPIAPEPVTETDRERIRDGDNPNADAMLRNMPDFKNVINDVFVATNNDIWMWIGSRDKNNWLIFDENGTPKRQIFAPEGVTLRFANNNLVYGVNTNEATVGVWKFSE